MLPFIELQFLQLLSKSDVPRKEYDSWLKIFDQLPSQQRLDLIMLFQTAPEKIYEFLNIVMKKAEKLEKGEQNFEEIIAEELRVFKK